MTGEREGSKDPAPLKVKKVEIEGREYVVCLNEEERRKDAHDRAAIIQSLRDQLTRSDEALVGNKGYRRFLKSDPAHQFAVDEAQVLQDARYDGLFVLRHDTGLDPVTVAHAYKMLLMVEDTFRAAKTILETRPVFHKRDETIQGYVFCSFLALCLKRELQIAMEKKSLKAEWNEIIRGLDNLHVVELELQDTTFLLRSTLCGHANTAIRAASAACQPSVSAIEKVIPPKDRKNVVPQYRRDHATR